MCGIAGIVLSGGRKIDRCLLDGMGEALAHRGPDGEGLYVDNGQVSAGLVARRLAVIDIPGGAQPMSTDDGRYTVVYNGEIYNAAEIRCDLETRGHRFKTRCDTEVVLRGYAQWQAELLHRLNGIWAFAIWDGVTRRMFIARDRLGVKPLVYVATSQGFVFASEIKALLRSGLVSRQLNPDALPHYLSSFVVPEPLSFFRDVRRLPAGCYVMVTPEGVTETSYWDCSFEEENDRGEAFYDREVRDLVHDAVRRQLGSDVPLGVFLSSGLDSGLVAAVASKALSEPVRTFTLGFEASATDERVGARAVATAIGARHTECVLTGQEVAAQLVHVLELHDEPSQSLVQNYFISELARRGVKVALSGLGGDELFASYPTHRVVDLLTRLDRLPPQLRHVTLWVAGLAGSRGRRLADLAVMGSDDRVTRRLLHQTDSATRKSLIAPDLRQVVDLEAPERHLAEHYGRARARHPLNRLLYVYLKTYLPNELLRVLDSMSMAHSLEARVPLLDHRLVECAMRMPARHKMSLSGGKIVLRRVASEILPQGVVQYRKQGFSVPLGQWLRKGLVEILHDTLCRPALERRGVFDPHAVRSLLDQALHGEPRSVQPVMMALTFELWARRVLDGSLGSAEALAPRIESGTPDLSVVVVNWNTREILRTCLASVETHLRGVAHEIIVVDNASVDGSSDMVERDFPGVRLIRNDTNVGFARANNLAMRVSRGRWILLLNSDTALVDDSVAKLFDRVQAEKDVGIAHCRLRLPDRRLQHTTYRFPSIGLALLEGCGFYKLLPRTARADILLAGYWDQHQERDVDWVAGAFMLLPRKVFEDTGGFSEKYFMYGEDMEWCYRVRRQGWRVRYYPDATITHRDHSSADLRWGDGRVDVCIEREVDFYANVYGRRWGAVFNVVKMLGILSRVLYCLARGLVERRDAGHYRNLRRIYVRCLRVHVALCMGAR